MTLRGVRWELTGMGTVLVVSLCVAASFAAQSGPVVLATDGVARATIVVSADLLPRASAAMPPSARAQEMPRLRVSDSARALVAEDGTPFLWLGDTAWSLPRLSPEDVETYMARRALQGFTVLQVCCGLDAPD